jgi:hypothetical protein
MRTLNPSKSMAFRPAVAACSARAKGGKARNREDSKLNRAEEGVQICLLGLKWRRAESEISGVARE